MRQLLDVVHQTVELPLPVYLLLASERNAVQPLVVSQVAENNFGFCIHLPKENQGAS